MGEAAGKGCTHDHGDGEHHHEGGDEEDQYYYHGGHGEKKDDGHGHGKKDDGHGHSHGEKKEKSAYKSGRKNINVDAAFLHALGDMIMSIGVCISATIIYFQPTWVIADPICTFVFSVIVCVTVTPTIKKCINVLMEGAPGDLDSDEIKKEIKKIAEEVGGTIEINDFHLWSISLGKYAMTAHVYHTAPGVGPKILRRVNKICKKDYGIDN